MLRANVVKIAAALGLVLLSAPALAAEFPAPENADDALAAAAKRFGLTDYTVDAAGCSEEGSAHCTYVVSGDVRVIVGNDTFIDEPSRLIAVYFTKDSNTAGFILAVGVMLTMVEPDMSKADRKAVGAKLVDPKQARAGVRVERDGVLYRSEFDPRIGVKVFAEPR